jgi:hypothetical protein
MSRQAVRYRSRPVQLGRIAFYFFVIVIGGVAVSFVVTAFQPHHTTGFKVGAVAYAVVATVGIAAVLRVSLTVLVVSPTQVRIVNSFRSHVISIDEVDHFAFGDTVPQANMWQTLVSGDDRHVVAITKDKQVLNVGALTLGPTPWGRKAVEGVVAKLNEAIGATRGATR